MRNESTRQPDALPDPSDPATHERAWVVGTRAGDTAAFERIFTTYYAVLVRFAYNYLHSRERAEEVIQELFLFIWERRQAWDVTGSLKSYLYRAARNRALDALKHERVERGWADRAIREQGGAEHGAPALDADAQLNVDELNAALQRAIEALPERCRQAYTLHRQQHLSYTEIAEVMGTTVGTVTIQIGKALKALRKSLADWLP